LSARSWVKGKPKAGPWSMKHLHRLIVTPRTHLSASTPDANNRQLDSDNQWLWRFAPQRMDAETVRDSVLHAAGRLDPRLGGPDLPSSAGMKTLRRSLYFHVSPEEQMPFLKVFDAADPTECYQRHTSIVPHQALALFNSKLVLVQSRLLARRMSKKFTDNKAFIKAAFEQVLARPATGKEHKICHEFLAAREKVYRSKSLKKTTTVNDADRPSADPRVHARENLVHSLFNHHDFVTVK